MGSAGTTRCALQGRRHALASPRRGFADGNRPEPPTGDFASRAYDDQIEASIAVTVLKAGSLPRASVAGQ
jgi:hypothetical protein